MSQEPRSKVAARSVKRVGVAAIVVVTAVLGFGSSGCLLLLAGAIEASKTSSPPPPTPPEIATSEEPAPAPAPARKQSGPPFDRSAAAASITEVSGTIQYCKVDGGPAGTGHVTLVFGPSGKVQSAIADQPPFADTPTGACIAGKFSEAHVPAFSGAPVKVGKTFSID